MADAGNRCTLTGRLYEWRTCGTAGFQPNVHDFNRGIHQFTKLIQRSAMPLVGIRRDGIELIKQSFAASVAVRVYVAPTWQDEETFCDRIPRPDQKGLVGPPC